MGKIILRFIQATILVAIMQLGGVGCYAQQPNDSTEKSSVRSLYYDLSNATDKSFHISHARAMYRGLNFNAFGGPHAYRVGIDSIQLNCTAEKLASEIADFIYWEKRFTDPESDPPKLKDESNMLVTGLPFPEFDENQGIWKAHFTLQPDDDKWVGQYEGVTIKPIKEAIGKHNATPAFMDYQWIHFQFKNESGKGIHMQQHDGKLVTGDREVYLFIPEVPPDNEFHGFAAHCFKGSMFRPEVGSKVVFSWAFPGSPPDKFEEFELPQFSDDYKNWYCYFTLGKDEKWTAVFQGVEEK